MLLTVLGSNGAYPTAGRPASGYLVSAGGAALWMDAGPGTFMALCGEIDPGELSGVFLSHRHPDHCADIFALYHALAYSPDGRAGKVRPIPLLCPADLAEALERFVDGSPSWRAVFDIVTLSAGGAASVGPLRISAARTNHPPPTFSPRIEAEGKVLTYTADTGPSEALEAHASGSDLLLAEATRAAGGEEDADPYAYHMTGVEAGAMASRAGVRRLMLTHIAPYVDPEQAVMDAESEFGGEVSLAAPGVRTAV